MPEVDATPRGKAWVGFPDFEQIHLISYMQLADAKAAVFLAIASGAIAYIAGHYGLGSLHGDNFFGHALLLSSATLFLVASATHAIAVIVPRRNHRRTGVIFYHHVTRSDSPAQYADGVLKMSEVEIFFEKMTYCHELANICDRKYRLLNYSLILGIIGYAMFLALLLWR